MWFSLVCLERYVKFNNSIVFIASLIGTIVLMFQICRIMLEAENKLTKVKIAS